MKIFLEFFFGSSAFSQKDIGLLAKFSSRGVKNAFHESRVPFRENFFTSEMNFLIDNFANCAEGLRPLAGNSQHGCQNGILAAAMNILSYFWTKFFSTDSWILKSKRSDGVEKTSLGLSKPHFSSPEENFRSFVGK